VAFDHLIIPFEFPCCQQWRTAVLLSKNNRHIAVYYGFSPPQLMQVSLESAVGGISTLTSDMLSLLIEKRTE